MKRVVIFGSAGSGKSTLARRIGEMTGIDVLHMDTLFWKPGWEKADDEEFQEAVADYVQKESWITDGNYSATMDMRLSLADTVIFLDVPRTVCMYRAIRRCLKYRGKSRPDITEGCDEKMDWEFCKWIWNYPKNSKPGTLRKIQMNSQGKEVYYLNGSKDVEDFIRHLKINNKSKMGSIF